MGNSGVFDVNDIRHLMDYQQWSSVGTLELITTQSDVSVSSVIFTDIKEAEYNVHLLTINDYQGASNDWLGLRFYESGTEEGTSVYDKALQYGYYSGSFGENKASNTNYLFTGVESTTSSNITGNGFTYIYNAGNKTKYTFTTHHGVNSAGQYMAFGGGVLPQLSIVDGIKIKGGAASSTVTGDFSLYGIRYS